MALSVHRWVARCRARFARFTLGRRARRARRAAGVHVSAVDTVEAEVRELVRRRGLDPVAGPRRRAPAGRRGRRRLRRARAHRRRCRRCRTRGSAARAVYDAVAGFGPLQRHLDDPTVEEIWINEPGRVFVARRGRSELTTTILTEGQVRDLVEKMLKTTGRRVDLSTPVRRRDAARRLAPARRHPRHHAQALVGQHPQVRAAGEHASTSSSRSARSPRRRPASSRPSMRGRAQRHRRRRHAGREDDPAELPGRRDPGPRAGHHLRGGLRAQARRCPTSSRCRPGSPTSRAPARSSCAAWSRRRCGCAPTGSSSARSGRRSASTCSSP